VTAPRGWLALPVLERQTFRATAIAGRRSS